MAKIMISAGEISGDVHGAKLVQEIKKMDPTHTFFGMGHSRMKNEGVQIMADLSTVSTIGFIEPIRYVPKILFTYFKMKRLMKRHKPDLLIPIDYQGYHMVLIAAAKKLNIPVIYYISPQEWQWGTEKGGRRVVELTDKILSIFKEEEAFYNALGGSAVYIGHPILDLAQSKITKDDFYAKLKIPSGVKIISIFPGSRPQEINYTLPILLGAASLLQQENPELKFVVSIVSQKYESEIKKKTAQSGLKNALFYVDNQYDLIAHTYLSLATSGTITLEHAILGTPCLVNYRFGKFSFWIAKKLLSKKFAKIKYFALPNILLQKQVLPEFLQDACNPQNLASQAMEWLENPARYREVQNELKQVRTKLGDEGVVRRAAKEIVDFLCTI